MLKNFDELRSRLIENKIKKTVAVVAAEEEHTLKAVMRATLEGLVKPVLIGPKDEILSVTAGMEGDTKAFLSECEIIDEKDFETCAKIACSMVNEGKADFIMKGKLETAELMRVAVSSKFGIRQSGTMSIVSFVESPYYHKIFGLSDTGLLIRPTKEQKKGAIANAVKAFKTLGVETPKIAVIAPIEYVNPKMPESVEAAEIKAEGIEGCIIEGPISYDLALSKEAAEIKGYSSPVAGDADLLLVPELCSGNIAAKSLYLMGGAKMGSTVLGGKVPIIISSRASSPEDKYLSIIMSSLM